MVLNTLLYILLIIIVVIVIIVALQILIGLFFILPVQGCEIACLYNTTDIDGIEP